MTNFSEILFILDRSGSMAGLESDTIGGFNSMLKKQQKEGTNALVSTFLFDHESILLHDRLPIADISPLTEKDYTARGTTALLDAIGNGVNHIKNIHKYARDEDKPINTMVFITTDGMENASRIFTLGDIKSLVNKQTELGWDFVFMGANIDAIDVAGSIGISSDRAVNFINDKAGINASWHAFASFISCPHTNNDSWRKNVDHDFSSRR